MQVDHQLKDFAARLGARMPTISPEGRADVGRRPTARMSESEFNALALELYALQFQRNLPYQRLCQARGIQPGTIGLWTQIPSVPTAAFKEHEFTCWPSDQRVAVFHSSGTTRQQPSRHYHGLASLALYETALWEWFAACVLSGKNRPLNVIALTPGPECAPHSSLVHMFATIQARLARSFPLPRATETDCRRRREESFFTPRTPHAVPYRECEASGLDSADSHHGVEGGQSPCHTRRDSDRSSAFVGRLGPDGGWELDFNAADAVLEAAQVDASPVLLMGTAFSFVHLLDHLAEADRRFQLPAGSRVLETGGYKGRSRSIPKAELHGFITARLGVPPEGIVCEYGMSELSSQAYSLPRPGSSARALAPFAFPPWARARVLSPETGAEVKEGEIGMLHVFDLANVFSVAAIATEDLAMRRGDGFELMGRAALAEPRGCSLMAT